MTTKPLKTFLVYKLVDGAWVFWMNARGKSVKQLHNSVWWKNKHLPRSFIRIVESKE